MGRDNASPIAPTIANHANIQYAPEADQIKSRSYKLRSTVNQNRHCRVKRRHTHPKGGSASPDALG
ncbi:hypothetical protein NDI43_09870 [Microcoleus vaginatus GB2-A3]|uniref:hypothetical protein n=1 Tax=Microcoleus vaginatus TaxID=119532 RepID=UPI0032A20ECB